MHKRSTSGSTKTCPHRSVRKRMKMKRYLMTKTEMLRIKKRMNKTKKDRNKIQTKRLYQKKS